MMNENMGNRYRVYEITEKQMRDIAEYASRKGIEAYKEEKKKEKIEKVEKTKEHLEEYRRVKKALEHEEKCSRQEIAELRFKMVKDLMEDIEGREGETERRVKKEREKKQEAMYFVTQMERAMEMYREEAEESRNEEEKRRYREIENIYIKNNMTVREVAEIENVSEKTVYKDLKIAYTILSTYLMTL